MSIRTSYLTVATVAEMLSVSELTVRRKIRNGEIPAVKLHRRPRGGAHPRGRARRLAPVRSTAIERSRGGMSRLFATHPRRDGRGQDDLDPKLRELLAKDGVKLGKYLSLERGRATVEIVTPERTYTVTVIDPDP